MYRVIATATKLNQHETKLLKIAAEEAGMSKSAYLRLALLDKLMPQIESAA